MPAVIDDDQLEVMNAYHRAFTSLLMLADDPDDWWARTVRRCAQRVKLLLIDGVEDFLAFETAAACVRAVDEMFDGRRERVATLLEGVRVRP